MIKIEITSAEVTVREGTSKQGRAYSIRKQTGYAYTLTPEGKALPHPTRCDINLSKDQQPFPAGLYTLRPESVYIDKFGALALAPRLVAVAVAGGSK